MENNSIANRLRENSIPIIEGTADDVVEELNNVFSHMDRTGTILMREALDKKKVILCVMVKDFVQPYAKLGGTVPVVIACPEHEYFWVGFRFNLGSMEWIEEQGYKFIIFNEDFSDTISIEDHRKEHLKRIGMKENGK